MKVTAAVWRATGYDVRQCTHGLVMTGHVSGIIAPTPVSRVRGMHRESGGCAAVRGGEYRWLGLDRADCFLQRFCSVSATTTTFLLLLLLQPRDVRFTNVCSQNRGPCHRSILSTHQWSCAPNEGRIRRVRKSCSGAHASASARFMVAACRQAACRQSPAARRPHHKTPTSTRRGGGSEAVAGEASLATPPGPRAEAGVELLPARLVVLAPLPIPVVCGTTAARVANGDEVLPTEKAPPRLRRRVQRLVGHAWNARVPTVGEWWVPLHWGVGHTLIYTRTQIGSLICVSD